MSKLSIIGIVIIVAIICMFSARRCRGIPGLSRLTGNGNVITQNRDIEPFTKLKLDGVFKTVITQDGGDASVKVEADDNLQKTIVIKNENETLSISTKEGLHFNNPTRMTVYINVKDLSSIINSSVGSLETKGTLKTPSLYLKTDAVGKTVLRIETDSLVADLNSVGAIDLSGSATSADIDNNSVGKLNAFHLHTDRLNFKNNAVGAAEIYADKELIIDHNGVGSVHYKGNATVKTINDNGVGKISKEN
jgi:hypothetical protein